MPMFRIHLATGDKHDIEAETADQARKIAAGRKLGIVAKIKRVRL